MIRLTMTGGALAVLAACDGAYTGPIGRDPVVDASYRAVVQVPTTTGTFPGIAAADTVVVQDSAGNGYAFAYAPVNAADYGGAAGTANIAVAGVLPGTDLGATPTAGSARMTGRYSMVRVDGAASGTDPAAWSVTRPSGTLSASIDFGTGRVMGASTDGALTLSAAGDPGFSGGFAGTASYAGTPGSFAGVLGPDDAVATVTGQGGGTFYAGGFAISR